MNSLNYDFILFSGLLAYTRFVAPSICKAFFKPSYYCFAIILAWILSSVLISVLLITLCNLHAFCFDLYNALQANGITIEQLTEGIK